MRGYKVEITSREGERKLPDCEGDKESLPMLFQKRVGTCPGCGRARASIPPKLPL